MCSFVLEAASVCKVIRQSALAVQLCPAHMLHSPPMTAYFILRPSKHTFFFVTDKHRWHENEEHDKTNGGKDPDNPSSVCIRLGVYVWLRRIIERCPNTKKTNFFFFVFWQFYRFKTNFKGYLQKNSGLSHLLWWMYYFHNNKNRSTTYVSLKKIFHVVDAFNFSKVYFYVVVLLLFAYLDLCCLSRKHTDFFFLNKKRL